MVSTSQPVEPGISKTPVVVCGGDVSTCVYMFLRFSWFDECQHVPKLSKVSGVSAGCHHPGANLPGDVVYERMVSTENYTGRGPPNPSQQATKAPVTPPELLEPPTKRARQPSAPLWNQGANVEIFLDTWIGST